MYPFVVGKPTGIEQLCNRHIAGEILQRAIGLAMGDDVGE